MLTHNLLSKYEHCLREFGVPIVDCLAPGCSAEQLDQAEEALGLTLSAEARLWWQWHDGARPSIARESRVGPWGPYRLDLALDYTLDYRAIRDEAELGSEWRADSWVEFAEGFGHSSLAIDCSGDDVAPVVFFDAVDSPDGLVTLPSIGDLVELWIRALELSVWTYDDGNLEMHPDRWPYGATKVFALD